MNTFVYDSLNDEFLCSTGGIGVIHRKRVFWKPYESVEKRTIFIVEFETGATVALENVELLIVYFNTRIQMKEQLFKNMGLPLNKKTNRLKMIHKELVSREEHILLVPSNEGVPMFDKAYR